MSFFETRAVTNRRESLIVAAYALEGLFAAFLLLLPFTPPGRRESNDAGQYWFIVWWLLALLCFHFVVLPFVTTRLGMVNVASDGHSFVLIHRRHFAVLLTEDDIAERLKPRLAGLTVVGAGEKVLISPRHFAYSSLLELINRQGQSRNDPGPGG